MNHEELKELKVQFEEFLTKKYIKFNKSPYGPPVLFCSQKGWDIEDGCGL
jgi:hypothetical protein